MIICNTEIRLRAPLTHTGDPAFLPHQSQALKAGSHLIFFFWGGGGLKKIFLPKFVFSGDHEKKKLFFLNVDF